MLNKQKRTLQKGDTLIEVLFAVTVFSLVVVLSLSLMNQGTSASIRALQISLVRQEIDSQAEALRFMNSSYVAAYRPGYAPTARTTPAEEYYAMMGAIGAGSVTRFGNNGNQTCPAVPSGSFIINTRTAQYVSGTAAVMQPASAASQTVYDGATLSQSQGLWVEAIRSASDGSGTRYTDFHIRACWDAPGMNVPMNLGTIVRLYEPANS